MEKTNVKLNKKKKKKEIVTAKPFKWFRENGMKTNQNKCLDITTKFSITDCSSENSNSEKLQGLIIDRKLNFNKHVTNLCNKTSKKIQALARVFPYIPVTQRKFLMNASILSLCSVCPLVWVKYSRVLILFILLSYLFIIFYYLLYVIHDIQR